MPSPYHGFTNHDPSAFHACRVNICNQSGEISPAIALQNPALPTAADSSLYTSNRLLGSVNMNVAEFVHDRRFHQTYTVPANPNQGRLEPFQLSYADYGDSESDAVVLICGALSSTRLSYVFLDCQAKSNHIRIVHPDRPGIGGSDSVELANRMSTWLQIIPPFLAHLNIAHISLMSHSGGIVYAMNTLLYYPHLLHPTKPFVCFIAPWVRPSHSRLIRVNAKRLLPTFYIRRKARPRRMASTTSPRRADTLQQIPTVCALLAEIDGCIAAEPVDGIPDDAQLLLRRSKTVSWSLPNMAWSDIDSAVALLRKVIAKENEMDSARRNWIIHTIHAEKDRIVGARGQRWFDNCWLKTVQHYGINDSNPRPDLYYTTGKAPHTHHATILNPVYGPSREWLARARSAFGGVEAYRPSYQFRSTNAAQSSTQAKEPTPSGWLAGILAAMPPA